MLRLTIRSLVANKIRFALTTLAVVLGVSFVVSSFVLSDGLRRTFGDLSTEIVGEVDYQVRPVSEFGTAEPLDEELLTAVAGVDGVAAVAGSVISEGVQPVKSDGSVIESVGPPQIGFSFIEDTALGSLSVVEGSAPAAGQFVLDVDSADRHGFEVGSSYDVITPTGRHHAELSGLVSFGANNDTLGAVLSAYPLADAQQMFDRAGQLDQIDITVADGANGAAVARSVGSALPTGTEIVDAQTLEAEQAADFNAGISLIGNVLLGFALVSLFVSGFIIVNTFSIVLAQRSRELALLRAVGASSRQVVASVLGEAALVGAAASAVGIAVGVGLTLGLRGLFDALGASLPASDLIVSPRTIAVALALGVGVTLLSAIGPARRAATVPPVAAMRMSVDPRGSDAGRRMALGAMVLALGVGGLAYGLFVASGTALILAAVGFGSIAAFVGATLVSPATVRPFTNLVGWPLQRSLGSAGKLAVRNAGRSPRRTATTSASLMIGLALVTLALVVGQSVKAQLSSTLDTAVRADAVVTDELETGIPTDVASQLAEVETFGAVSTFADADLRVAGEVVEVESTELALVNRVLTLGVADESGASDWAGGVLVHESVVDQPGHAVGDVLSFESGTGAVATAPVVGVFSEQLIIESDYLLDRSVLAQLVPSGDPSFLLLDAAEGASAADVEAALAGLRVDHPQLAIDSSASFRENAEATIDSALLVVNALLALAFVIALLGIANTLALAVYERTRELGMMRAVGMTRRQMRRMIRWEAVLIAAFGTAMGVGLGLGFSWAVVQAVPESITSTFSIPVSRVLLMAFVAAAAGLVAAIVPARRAGRLDVLAAISQ